ncbi:MAG: hypothetical protein HY608_01410 [Planctomycetes bacterium]|nr:hypothetical protein [Planctomycetota bacterium]
MPITAYMAALAGAAAGGLAWALLSWATGYEIGYVAWGIGGLVGFAAARFGANGKYSGAVCALLSLLAIFGGKVAAVRLALPGELAKQPFVARLLFEEIRGDAEAFADLGSEEEHAAFMVEHRYVKGKSDPSEVTPEELMAFREIAVPELREIAAGTLGYEEWRDRRIDKGIEGLSDEGGITGLVVKNLGPIDLLFAFLGLVTAWRLGNIGLQGQAAAATVRTGPPPAPGGPTPPSGGAAPPPLTPDRPTLV